MVSPLISIIMPAFNSGDFIKESIQSVLNQSYENFELLIIDDGSTDNTCDIAALFLHDKRVQLLTQSNQGVSAARNYAVSKSQGMWLAFLDSDDIWLSNKLTEQFIETKGYNWSITDSYYFGRDDINGKKRSELSVIKEDNVFSDLLLENFITTSTVLLTKEVFLNFGQFDQNLKALEDWKLWLDIAKENPLKFVNKPLAKYRVTVGSTSRRARQVLPLHISVIDSVLNQSNQLKQYKKPAYSKAYTICSYIAEDANDKSFACYCAWKAFINTPLNLKLLKRVASTLLKLK